jgi:hypothetical protein
MSLCTESALGMVVSSLRVWEVLDRVVVRAVLGLVTWVAVPGPVMVVRTVLGLVLVVVVVVVVVVGRIMVVRAVFGLVLGVAVVGRVFPWRPVLCFWRSISRILALVYCGTAEK